jgi:hypothetical protein
LETSANPVIRFSRQNGMSSSIFSAGRSFSFSPAGEQVSEGHIMSMRQTAINIMLAKAARSRPQPLRIRIVTSQGN